MREVGICLAPTMRARSSLAVINTAGELLDLDVVHSDREIVQWMTRWASRHCHVAIALDAPSIPSPAEVVHEAADEPYVDRVDRLVRLLELDPTPGSDALRRIAPLPSDLEEAPPLSVHTTQPMHTAHGVIAGRPPALAGMVAFLESLQGSDVPLFVGGCGKWAALRQACLAPGQTAHAQQLRSGLEAVASAYLARVLRIRPELARATVRTWRDHTRRVAGADRPAGDGASGRRVRRPLLVLEVAGVPDPADPERAGRWGEAVTRAVSDRPRLASQTRVGISLTFRTNTASGGADLDRLVACALEALTGPADPRPSQAGPRRGRALVSRAQVDAVEARRRPARGDENPGLTAEIFDLDDSAAQSVAPPAGTPGTRDEQVRGHLARDIHGVLGHRD